MSEPAPEFAAPTGSVRSWRPSTALLLCAVLLAGALVRLVNWAQVKDGSILYFHQWSQSDMAFFHDWGRQIAAGELLNAPRPYHRWHGEVALEVHQRQRPNEPFDERWGRALWNRWLGDKAFYQDPLYAYLLGAVYRLLGPSVVPVLLLQALMGLACVALVFCLGLDLGGRVTAAVAGLLAALYAPLVFFEGTLLRGVLLAFLTLALVAAAQRGQRSERPARWWVAAGVCGGLLVLAHSMGLPLVAALAAVPVLCERGARRRRTLLAYAAGCLLGFAPGAARNLAVGLPPFATTASGPVNVIITNAADRNVWAGFSISRHTAEIMAATDGKLLPIVRATIATHDSFGSWLRLTAEKPLVFFNRRETVDNINFDYFLLQAPCADWLGVRFALVAPLAAAGLVLAGRRLRHWLPLLLALASGFVVAVAFFTLSRLRLTSALLLAPLAAYALQESWTRLRERRARSLAGAGAAGLAMLALAFVPARGGPLVRDSDYAVGNAIALHRARERLRNDDLEGALRTVRVQLRTEPRDLRALDPAAGQGRLSEDSARVAGLFVDLHRMAATLHQEAEDPKAAAAEIQRARVLEVVARQYGARQSHPGS